MKTKQEIEILMKASEGALLAIYGIELEMNKIAVKAGFYDWYHVVEKYDMEDRRATVLFTKGTFCDLKNKRNALVKNVLTLPQRIDMATELERLSGSTDIPQHHATFRCGED